MTTLANAVLLAAGRGTRMAPLTDQVPKPLLPIGGVPLLGLTIAALIDADVEHIVVVTGDRATEIEDYLAKERAGRAGFDRVVTAHNPRFREDTNVFSTHVGVGALSDSGRGYLVVETDILMEAQGWARVLERAGGEASFWVTSDVYGPQLTGGAVDVDPRGAIRSMVYAPRYDARFAGWRKLLGMLYVAPRQVLADRGYREAQIERSVAAYYMDPWVEHLGDLPCEALPVDPFFATSFNDAASFERAAQAYRALQRAA